MMPIPDENVVGFDISAVEVGLQKISNLFLKYNTTLVTVTSSSERFNAAGDVISQTFKGINTAGDTVTRTFENIKNKLVETSRSFTNNSADLKDNLERLRAFAAAGPLAEQIFKKNAAGRFTTDTGQFVSRAKLDEVRKIEDEITALLIAENKKRATAEAATRADILRDWKATRQAYRDLIADRIREHRKAVAEEIQAMARRTAAFDFAQSAQAIKPIGFATASPQSLQAYKNSLANISQLIEKGKTTAFEAAQIRAEIIGRQGKVYTGTRQEVAQAINGMIQAEKNLTNNTVSNKVKQIAANTSLSKSTQQTSKQLIISWDTIFRFIQFRILYAGIFAVVNALKEGTRQAIEFQIQISEIRTISQQNQQSFAAWSNELRGLSDQFGSPINDVAKGTYEAISNQIAQGAESTKFMASAMKFAATTVSTTSESVDLLSSALNSFELDATNTERVAAVLFKTIELGRVRASEMANSFGRVGVTSHAVGISLEETAAAIATLTINGTRYSEAFTQINNITTALLKPSKEMKAVLASWGVESGEAAIATFGFSGVLKKLEEASHGSATELAQLFPNVRGLRGAIGLTRSSLEGYDQTLAKIQASTGDYANATKIAFESSGKTVEIEINKLKNQFIAEGSAITDALAGMNASFSSATGVIAILVNILGGGNGLSAAIQNLISITQVALKVFIAFKVATLLQSTSSRVMISLFAGWSEGITSLTTKTLHQTTATQAMNGAMAAGKNAMAALLTPANALLAVITLLVIAQQRIAENESEIANIREETIANLNKQYEEQRAKREAQLDAETKLVTEAINKQYQVRFQAIAATAILVNKEVDQQKAKVKELAAAIKDMFQLQVKTAEDAISHLEERIKGAREGALKAAEAIASLKDDFNQRVFKVKFNAADDVEKIKLQKQQIVGLMKEIPGLLDTKKIDPTKATETINKVLEKSKQADDQIAALADQRSDAEKKRLEITKKISELEERAKASGGIQQTKQQIAALAKLEQAAKTAHGRRKDQLLEQIRLQKQSAQSDLGSERDAESQRRAQVELASAKEQLALLDAQIKELPDQVKYLDLIDKYHASIRANIEAYNKALSQTTTADQKQAEIAKKQLEALKTSFDAINKFAVSKTIKDATGKQTELSRFDQLVGAAVSAGLKDQNALLQISKFRVELEKQADLQIQVNTLATQQQTLNQQKSQLIKQQEDVVAIKKKNEESFDTALATVRGVFSEARAGTRKGLASAIPFAESSEVTDIARQFGEITKQLESGNRNPQLVAQLETKMNELFAKLDFHMAGLNTNVLKEGKGGAPDVTTLDVQKDAKRALNVMQAYFANVKRTQDLERNVKQAQGNVGVQLDQLQAAMLKNAQNFNQSSVTYIQGIQDATTAINNLQQSINQINNTVQSNPLPNTAIPTPAPKAPTTTAPTTQPSKGPVAVNLNFNATGNAQADAYTIGRELQRLIRTGRLDFGGNDGRA
jgi:TP901 family phage tail tape measure protein